MPNRQQRRRAEAIKRKTTKPAPVRARVRPTAARVIKSTVPVQITAAAGDPTAQKRFEMTAYTGEPMNISGFELPVIIDLSTVDITAQRIPILYDHCPEVDYLVGQSDRITSDGSSIKAAGTVNGVGAKAQAIRDTAANGYVWQASVGAEPAELDEIREGETAQVNGRTYTGPAFIARGCVLREISFVVLGGDRKTSALVAKNKAAKPIKGQAMNFQDYLASLGFADPSAIDPEQLSTLIETYAQQYADGIEDSAEADPLAVETPANAAAETNDPANMEETGAHDPLEEPTKQKPMPANAAAKRVTITAAAKAAADVRRAVIAEEERIAGIRKIAAKYGEPEITVGKECHPLTSHAIKAGWSVKDTELVALRNDRAKSPHVNIRAEGSGQMTQEALLGAVMLRAGLKLDNRLFPKMHAAPDWLKKDINDPNRNRVMEAAHAYSDFSMPDICREILRIEGRLKSGMSRPEMIRAAMSGTGFSNIFSTNVNLMLLSTYLESVDSTAGWTTTVDVADFKTNERTRVQVGEGLTKRARGQEADHTSFTDQTETYAISHYSRQFTVDYIDIVNDSMGAMSDTPQKFGIAAARLRPDLVYAAVLANANLAGTGRALFNSTDGNTAAGALTVANLEAAIASMAAQRENNVNLNVDATHLIVPQALKFTALKLVTSPALVQSGTTDIVNGSTNVIPTLNLTIAADSRLQNGVTDPSTGTAYGGSSTAWFLASTYMNTIEVAFLRGTGRAPEVRSNIYDREGKFGINYDVSLSIGAKPLDWRGLWRRTG